MLLDKDFFFPFSFSFLGFLNLKTISSKKLLSSFVMVLLKKFSGVISDINSKSLKLICCSLSLKIMKKTFFSASGYLSGVFLLYCWFEPSWVIVSYSVFASLDINNFDVIYFLFFTFILKKNNKTKDKNS